METVQNTDQRVRKVVVKEPLEISRVYAATFQKEGTLTAELKQTIETTSFYPSKSVSNNLQDNPFATADFNFAEQEYSSKETRVAWVPVPVGSTVESVAAKITSLENACIYKILANKPILSEDQKYALSATPPLTTMDAIADRQAVRYSATDPKAGQLILDPNGKPQYKATYFKSSLQEDMDLRTVEPGDFYASVEMKVELATASQHVSAVQSVL